MRVAGVPFAFAITRLACPGRGMEMAKGTVTPFVKPEPVGIRIGDVFTALKW